MAQYLLKRYDIGEGSPILIKFRINPQYAKKIADVLEIQNRSEKNEWRLTRKKERLAKLMKIDAYLHQRTDAAGNVQADTGIAVFPNGKLGNAFTLKNVWEDFLLMGYNIVDVYSYQKENDKMIFLTFVFEEKDENDFPIKVEHLFLELLEKKYQHVHIWDNPDGTCTINSAHIDESKTVFPALRIGPAEKGVLLSFTKAEETVVA